jgi:hypothetical protein
VALVTRARRFKVSGYAVDKRTIWTKSAGWGTRLRLHAVTAAVKSQDRMSLPAANAPRPIRSSSPARPVEPRLSRLRVTEALAGLCLLLLCIAPAGVAASPTPSPKPTVDSAELNARLKAAAAKPNMVMPPTRTPSTPQHTELIVETNKKGEVTRVRAGKGGPDPLFNTMVYGNALQAYIHTADGGAIAGTYRLTYDYSPETKNVKRSVELIKEGGVDPDAIGAVEDMMSVNDKRMKLDAKLWEQLKKNQKAMEAKASPKPQT